VSVKTPSLFNLYIFPKLSAKKIELSVIETGEVIGESALNLCTIDPSFLSRKANFTLEVTIILSLK
jgi:hypothetical protein